MRRVFISFDYDHDVELKDALIGQSRNPDSPFEIADYSVKEKLSGNWREGVRNRMRYVDVVVVICGWYTHTATGVSAEIEIAREEDVPYFLLRGRRNGAIRKPKAAYYNDIVYDWTWDKLRWLIGG